MNRSLLYGLIVGAATATLTFILARALPVNVDATGLYELSYYTYRIPMPDETGYDPPEGDPGAGFDVYDNSYILSLISKCRVQKFEVSARILPDSSFLTVVRFSALAKSEQVGCLAKFTDDRGFVVLNKVAY